MARSKREILVYSQIDSGRIHFPNTWKDSDLSGFYRAHDFIVREGHKVTSSTDTGSIKMREKTGVLTRNTLFPTRRASQMNESVQNPEISSGLTDSRTWCRGIAHLKKNDRIFARLIDRAGPIKFEPDEDHYEAIVGSIIYQQLAGTAARAILNRFKALYGGRIPTPEEYLATRTAKLRRSGLSPQKISYIRDLCKRLQNKTLDLERLSSIPDEEAIRALDEVRGIGRWTAEMFLLFMLGRTDILPVDDLGVRKATQRVYNFASFRKERSSTSSQSNGTHTLRSQYYTSGRAWKKQTLQQSGSSL